MFRHSRYFDKNEGKHNLFGEWDNLREDEDFSQDRPEPQESRKKSQIEIEEEE